VDGEKKNQIQEQEQKPSHIVTAEQLEKLPLEQQLELATRALCGYAKEYGIMISEFSQMLELFRKEITRLNAIIMAEELRAELRRREFERNNTARKGKPHLQHKRER